MRGIPGSLILLVGLAAGCASQPVLSPGPRPAAPPPRVEAAPAPGPARIPRTDEAATERFLDTQIGASGGGSAQPAAEPAPGATSVDAYRQRPSPRTTDEAATQIFLDHEIERRRYASPVLVEPVVEPRTVYVEPRVVYVGHRPVMPWGTIFGASVGAVVGDASGHRGRGAAIGAGVGLLLDLSRPR
jgi:hypothetical protein